MGKNKKYSLAEQEFIYESVKANMDMSSLRNTLKEKFGVDRSEKTVKSVYATMFRIKGGV